MAKENIEEVKTIVKKARKKAKRYKYTQQEKDSIFNTEFYPHYDMLYKYALKLTKDEDDAKDLLQDTFANAHKNIAQYEKGTNGKAWLYRAMRNHFLNLKKREPIGKTDLSYIPASKQLNPERGLDGLSDEYLEVTSVVQKENLYPFLLHVLEGYSYEEIAELCKVPLGTIRTRISRARETMKTFLLNKTDKENGSLI